VFERSWSFKKPCIAHMAINHPKEKVHVQA
jgi:hypothetical protein